MDLVQFQTFLETPLYIQISVCILTYIFVQNLSLHIIKQVFETIQKHQNLKFIELFQ